MESFSEDNYNRKLDIIMKMLPSVQKVSFNEAYDPGTGKMLRFCGILGNPHQQIRTIHVAGTNGKGSVANMLSSALVAAGLKVGIYTSPHLVDFRERARICDGRKKESVRLISKEYVYDFISHYEPDMRNLGLTFFEMTTGLAFKWFADEQVDVAVIEVGLGGRLDSTNIITPDLSVVTSIALDHCAILGDTLSEIAGEKAGIFKKDVPALVGEYLPQTRPVFEAKAEGLCKLTFAEDIVPSGWSRKDEILAKMDLRGRYQEKNLRTVLAALDILRTMQPYAGLSDEAAVLNALERTAAIMAFHGRWERICETPFTLADIGHNPAALTENFSQLRSMLSSGEFTSLIIVYAIMADKDLDGIMPLMPADADYIFTNPAISRALPEQSLAERYRSFCAAQGRSGDRVHEAATAKEALDLARSLASDVEAAGGRPLVYVGGSSYLVSEVLELLGVQDSAK